MERNLMVAGFGGQGVMTLGKFLADATCNSTDKNVTFFPSYGAEQRGGTANCYVVIADEEIGAPLGDAMDDLIVMNDPSLAKFLYKLVPITLFAAAGRTMVRPAAVYNAQSASALGDEFRCASRLVWPLASLRHSAMRKVFFCGVHAAAKNGLDLFRGLRAANSVRLKKLPRP